MRECSSEAHKEELASSYCQDCKIYMCNQCEKFHEILFSCHHQYKLDDNKDNNDEIFTGLCEEKNHSSELKIFCKTHNKLCCGECLTKINENNYGEHKDCDICLIEQTIEEFRIKFEDNNKIKEQLKMDIQKTFSKLRVDLSNREDELLEQVDKNFDLFINEDIIKESENLPNKIKTSLEKGKLIDNQCDKVKLNSFINDCLNIENNIKNIEILNKKIVKGKSENPMFTFSSEGENQISELIKKFGKIINAKFFSAIEFDQKLVMSWLNDRMFYSKLLFRKTRDGSTTKDFHDKCDNKGNTIVFIETTTGYKFGGYTELQWDKSETGKKDNSTFIFSLNKRQKYTARNDNYSIFCSKTLGPNFGNGSNPEICFDCDFDKSPSSSRTVSLISTSASSIEIGNILMDEPFS
ncbi:TLD-domain-containing protein [Neocallimastix sp. 'constans']